MKTLLIDDNSELTTYIVHQTVSIVPLTWEAVKLRVPKKMPPELVFYNGMFLHDLLPEGSPLPLGEIHEAGDIWYGNHSRAEIHGIKAKNHLVLAYHWEEPIPDPQLKNIGRLFPAFIDCDVFNSNLLSCGWISEGTVPHAAAMDFLNAWWDNPDQNLAPRWLPVEQKEETSTTGVPCTMISGNTITTNLPTPTPPRSVGHALVQLVNKGTGYIDGGVWFQNGYADVINAETKQHYAQFEYADTNFSTKLIEFVRTKLPLSGQSDYHDRSKEELKEIARDMVAQRIFFSTQLDDQRLLPSVFMTIGFMGHESLFYYLDHQLEIFYEYYDKASPRGINGYPCFFSHHCMSKSEYKMTLDLYFQMQTALEQI